MGATSVVIVGAGHAGAQAAIALRAGEFTGSILMITEEADLPYERPPLSKDFLAGQKTFDQLLMRPSQFWSERRIDVRTGTHVRSVDARMHRILLDDDQWLQYERLIWAAGGNARRLSCPGAELDGVHTLRTRSDVERMRAVLDSVERVVVIGGGYIGLETAAVLTKLGKHVVLLEACERVLARVAGPELSRFFEMAHRAEGVDVRTSTTLECIIGEQGKATGVQLRGGEILPADMIVVGIGIVPSVAQLLEAGAQGGDGVLVDEYCRTTLPDIFAIGDCALHSNRYADGAQVRLESVQNANDQANVAARAICGAPVPYDAVPWFWSNQYDLKLQTVGLSSGYDAAVVRGDPASRMFSVVYLKQGRVIALDCVNNPRDYMQGRKLVAGRVAVDVRKLQDPGVALKDVCG